VRAELAFSVFPRFFRLGDVEEKEESYLLIDRDVDIDLGPELFGRVFLRFARKCVAQLAA